jgi:transposase
MHETKGGIGPIKALEREDREPRQVNEIPRKASAYFAMVELDRRSKP